LKTANPESKQETFQLDYRNPVRPHRYAAELSVEEQDSLRKEFVQVLGAHERRVGLLSVILVIGIGLFLITAWVGLTLCGIVPMVIMLALYPVYRPPALRCPNCRNKVAKPIGEFCPQCAKRALAPGNFLFAPSCDACGQVMRNNRYTSYTVHACTHCGFWLDDKGL
jgi:hypothetical protein